MSQPITPETFDYSYYQEKYNDKDIKKMDTPRELIWKHWITYGQSHNRNPIDRVSTTQPEKNFEILKMLYCEIKKNSDLVKERLLCELSYGIYDYNDIANACKSQYPPTPTTSSPQPPTQSEIINWREKYVFDQYNIFVKKCDQMQADLLSYVITKYSYSYAKTNWNRYINMGVNEYFTLILNMYNFDYIDNTSTNKAKLLPPSSLNCDMNAIYFDREYYFNLYPVLRKAFKNPDDVIKNFMIHAVREKIPNKAIFELRKTIQEFILNTFLLAKLPPTALNPSQQPIIYILTRTCNREQMFGNCVKSIEMQKYPNIRHIVGYDNEETAKYAIAAKAFDKVNLIEHKKRKIHPNQYIDFMYDSIKDPGWVMVLDDDDHFVTPDALRYITTHLSNNPMRLVMWMFYRTDRMIYPVNKSNPVVGEMASCAYIYHSSIIQKKFWTPGGLGDYGFFNYIFRKTTDHVYLDFPLTGTGYEDQISGWTAE